MPTSTGPQSTPIGSDRREHQRISSSELPKRTLIQIPNRPAVSLIDLSVGGAMLNAPFQMLPGSRITLAVVASGERRVVPFQLLRCWVADLNHGVRYFAAGAFDQTLQLKTTLTDIAGTGPSADRLLERLDALLRSSQAVDLSSRGVLFNDLLSWVVAGLRLRRPADEISTQIKGRLQRQFHSLVIGVASGSSFQDPSKSARFFGLDFKSAGVLSSSDRRFLRASAQLISLIGSDAENQALPSTVSTTSGQLEPSLIVHTVSDWQSLIRGGAMATQMTATGW